MDMKRQAGHPVLGWAGITIPVCMAMTVAACGSAPHVSRVNAVPSEFRAACGQPGARVTVRKVPVTVSHAACDLTGVMITYPGHGGAAVPRGHGGTGIGNSQGFTLTVHRGTLDVTVNVRPGPAGNG